MQTINTATVHTVMSFNAMVRKAQKGAHITIRFVHIPLEEIEVVGRCDASFANVTDGRAKDNDTPLASQAGYMIGLAQKDEVAQGSGRLTLAMWKTHKIKRKVRSTLAAECAAANECLEASDLLRTHLIELLEGQPLDRREWRQKVRAVPKSLVTDSRSMFDFLNKRGSTPSDKRLRLDLEMIRDEMDDEGLKVKWVNTHQQLADALTKGSLDASMYLMMVARSAKYALTVDERLSEEVAEFKKQRRYEEQEVRNRKRRVMAEYKRKQQKHKEDAGGDTVMKDAGGKDAGGDIEMKDAEMKQADGDVEMGDADDDDAMQVGDLCVALVQALVAAAAVTGSVICFGWRQGARRSRQEGPEEGRSRREG